MKTKFVLLSTLASLCLAATQNTSIAAPPAAGNWSAQPTFEDNFDGPRLDSTKWSTGYRWPDVINNEMQGFVPENVSVEDGVCKIKAEKRDVQNTDWVGYKAGKQAYASGAIQTYNKFAQAYGYFEVKAKMPGGKGTWPAFWLLPDRGAAVKNVDERTTVGGGYKGTPIARGVEIDIFEIMGSWVDPKTGAGKSHSGYFWGYNGKSAWGDYAKTNSGAGPEPFLVANQNTEFHLYGLAWGPGKLDYYIDGVKVLSREESPSQTKVGSAPHYMILNVSLKTDDWTPKKIPVAEIDADLPRTMVIDYVKVWSGAPTPNPAPVAEGLYRMTPLSDPTKCLQVDGAGMDDGAKINQGTYTGAANQQWMLSYQGGMVYEFKSKSSGKVLSVVGGLTADKTRLEQSVDTDAPAGRWKLQAAGPPGFFKIGPMVIVKSALSTWGKTEGAGAYIDFSSGDSGQRWKFEPVEAPAGVPVAVTAPAPAPISNPAPVQAPATSPASAPGDPTLPATATGVAMTANSADSITLSWYRAPNNDATGYTVSSSSTKDGPFSRVASVKERTARVEKLPADTTFFFKVATVSAKGESPPSAPVMGFTIKPTKGAPFPVRIAKNMCVSLNATITSSPAPTTGKLADLVDGSDATSAALTGPCEVKIKLNTNVSIEDADYLMLNFRSDQTGQGYAYNINWRSLKNYVISESFDSTNGTDGTWTEISKGSNRYLDGVIAFPNHKPKWISVKNSDGFQMCRLDVFRAAPKGFRNDSWIFTGDSLIVQDMIGGAPDRHSAWFSDLVRQQHPDRYPMVVNSSLGGEMMANTLGRLKNQLPLYAAPAGSQIPLGTNVCFEPGFNDIGVGGGLWMGDRFKKTLGEAQQLCQTNGLILVPVRVEFSTSYLDKTTLEPEKCNVFVNTLAANLAGVDVFCRANTPYACDAKTQLPFADYWNYTRKNHDTALAKDGVHHTKSGSDGINQLWAQVADKMIYSRQP